MKNIKLKNYHILVTLILVFVAVLLVLNINKNITDNLLLQ